ncbi:dTDP-4-dehydrorhamnose 3,5-epimerase, partial [Ralstonia pseudosolanacearum]|uniref:dTDP-4-dehydrorhamnose 3,5-epimerase n=1 Tax=Ralstonia pseudosolanacearum TaxID=1310165 RepID=UPI003CF1293F
MTQITATSLPEVLIVTPRRFGDARGWFSETWNSQTWAQLGSDLPDFVQDNHSYSAQAGTLRGLHYQSPPHAQAKLVRCSRGAIWDVAVDIRAGSPRYGQWVGVDLSVENGQQLFVPAGFLHGFITRTPYCEVQYKCSDF